MTDVVAQLVDLHVMRWQEGAPRYLVMRRSPNEIYEHIWQGVTGKINTGETAWQTCLRELKEETGLEPTHLWAVDHVNLFYEPATDTLHTIPVFGAEVEEREVVLSKEHQEYRWCSVEEAAALLLWDQQRRGLWAFHDMLTKSTTKLHWTEVSFRDEK